MSKMRISKVIWQVCLFSILNSGINTYCQNKSTIQRLHKVTLRESHTGTVEIDTKLLDSYGLLPNNEREFYLEARQIFTIKDNANFSHPDIVKSAKKHNISLMGGPILGNLHVYDVTLWLRPAKSSPLHVIVTSENGDFKKEYIKRSIKPGIEERIVLDGLNSNTNYKYQVYIKKQEVAQGKFKTAPLYKEKSIFRVTFGSCFHKIGLHNPNLTSQIIQREPHAMMLLGDIAVDDREDSINMHRSDYLLRDVSKSWQNLASNVPLYTSWDDHDYMNNDLSGIPNRFTKADQEALRKVWLQNWNNPDNEREGVYFNSQVGPVEIIMLDTRSCRTIEERGNYGSYLGEEQLTWLKNTLKNSNAPFKIISSGTMWSDDISNGKDSWGTWDTLAREEIFSLIEEENISGVLLISGDRHGARGFTIPRASGFKLHEFEAASLGGVPGPKAMAKDTVNQLFGYHGASIIAFGEFTFNTIGVEPTVTFRLIDELGEILEEYLLKYDQLSPKINKEI